MRALLAFLTLCTLCTAIFFASAADAHEVRPAYLKITEAETPGHYDIMWKEPLKGGMRLKITPVFPGTCKEVAREMSEKSNIALTQKFTMACGPQGLEGEPIKIDGLHLTLVDVFVETLGQDGAAQTRILKPDDPSFVLSFSSGSARQGYIGLGIEHLLLGFDHILFVIGLVLLIRAPVALLKVITSFTVAHSLTLALSTLGLVRLDQSSVEAVIALSIALLAVEIVRSGDNEKGLLFQYPWAITFVFGLLHGFGFAGALADIGLPEGAAAWALLFFNIGVEIGQILIVGATLMVLYLLRHIGPMVMTRLPSVTATGPELALAIDRRTTLALAYLIGTLAAYWLIERLPALV